MSLRCYPRPPLILTFNELFGADPIVQSPLLDPSGLFVYPDRVKEMAEMYDAWEKHVRDDSGSGSASG